LPGGSGSIGRLAAIIAFLNLVRLCLQIMSSHIPETHREN